MKTIAVIPSRYGSTRFPGKSLAPICGKPLVRWVAEACLRAKTLDEVIVATDDERIAAAVEGTGARAVMTPSDLPSGTDRVAVAAQAADGDVVVNVQGDEPLIDPALIDAVADKLRLDAEGRFQMSTACAPIRTAEELAARALLLALGDPVQARRRGGPRHGPLAAPHRHLRLPRRVPAEARRHAALRAGEGRVARAASRALARRPHRRRPHRRARRRRRPPRGRPDRRGADARARPRLAWPSAREVAPARRFC